MEKSKILKDAIKTMRMANKQFASAIDAMENGSGRDKVIDQLMAVEVLTKKCNKEYCNVLKTECDALIEKMGEHSGITKEEELFLEKISKSLPGLALESYKEVLVLLGQTEASLNKR